MIKAIIGIVLIIWAFKAGIGTYEQNRAEIFQGGVGTFLNLLALIIGLGLIIWAFF